MEENNKGQFIERTTEDGVRYVMYVPENVNADTPVFTYVHGSGGPGYDWTVGKNAVINNGSNSIIIFPTMEWSSDWGEKTMNVVNDVKEEYGITNKTVSSSGFSMGGFAGYVTVAENIKQNPDCEPQTVFFIDDYGRKTYYNYEKTLSDTETVQAFKDNQTVFFIYEPSGKNPAAARAYGQSGLNVIRVVCLGQDHTGINKYFFENGVYDYMAGGTLPEQGYKYQKYDQETGQWVDIPYEEIATKDALNNYFNIDTFKANVDRLYKLPEITIKSDDKTLETYINNIRAEIRKTSFLTANFNEPGYLSTTQVPTAIPDLVNNYFSMTSSLLNSIATKTAKIASIAGEIDYLDKTLSSRAEEVNKQQPLFVVGNMISDTIISETVPEDEKYADVTLTPPVLEEDEEEPTTEQPTEQEQTQQQTPTTPSVQPEQEQPETTTPIPSEKEDDTQPEQEGTTGTVPPVLPETEEEKEEFKIEEYFPEYEELYSTENQVVYNYNDEYKVVIHYEDDKIIGVEHYYDYGSEEAATTAVEQLHEQYKDVENFDQVIQKDQYVKVIFKEDMYKDLTLDEFKETYKELEEVVEEAI